MDKGRPAIADQPCQVGVHAVDAGCLVSRFERLIEREEPLMMAIEESPRKMGHSDAAGDADNPVPPAGDSQRARPGQQARADAGPRHARDEEPQKAIGPRDGDKLVARRVGHQLATEEAGPLHPALSPGQSDSQRHRQDNPARRIAPRLLPRRVMRDVPPGGPPGHPREDASCRSTEPGAAAHRPGHAPQCGKEERRQNEIVRQIKPAVVRHDCSCSKGVGRESAQSAKSITANGAVPAANWTSGGHANLRRSPRVMPAFRP